MKSIRCSVGDIRLDRFIRKEISANISQSFLEKMIRKKRIMVDGESQSSSFRLKRDQLVSIFFEIDPEAKSNHQCVNKDTIDFFISSKIYEDDDMIAINKPRNFASQGGINISYSKSIDNIFKNIDSNYRMVHRLDKDTSGVMLIAKNYSSSRKICALFKSKSINKIYYAIVSGRPNNNYGIIKSVIHLNKPIAITEYSLSYFCPQKRISLLKLIPHTGQKHQIRIHLSGIQCPIIGDHCYQSANNTNYHNIRLMLHSYSILLPNKPLIMQALPDDMVNLIGNQNIQILA